ncbi:uncharacterized protein HMPREF1120_08691 [Exophiala dermatitidis NIH/UT8656]|uniref:Uncharacterized protein n=1 Tax=Exophiala dermatitidis (strain ATCC 34100 / CBS 525.76 / NIH/UT8656) TaxID=858893 RepID=H6C9N0_EXODN|nr:uncharacterized protein HMPREF1120_08691 [Exophiala dermatitidis NIH/UT8656]EHY60746.1 hypothetical protein HMPREF1120_08691 [Exophiala dermatitidis NIH/UT8656]
MCLWKAPGLSMPQYEPQVTRTRVPCQSHRIPEVLVPEARDLLRANRESWRAAWGRRRNSDAHIFYLPAHNQRVAGAAKTGGSGGSPATPARSGARGPAARRLGPTPIAPILRSLLAAANGSPSPSPPAPTPAPWPLAVSPEDFVARVKKSISMSRFPKRKCLEFMSCFGRTYKRSWTCACHYTKHLCGVNSKFKVGH